METTVTMEASDVSKIEKSGVTAAWAVAAELNVETPWVDVSGKHEQTGSVNKQQEAVSALKSSTRQTRTFVLGGEPPSDVSEEARHGFGEWAKTVPLKPMPVKITLTGLDKTEPFQCDLLPKKGSALLDMYRAKKVTYTAQQQTRCAQMRATLKNMFNKYQNRALRSFRTENMNAEVAKQQVGGVKFWSEGVQVCPSNIKSKNGRFQLQFQCDGSLALLDEYGTSQWDANTGGKCTGDGAVVVMQKSVLEIKCSLEDKFLWRSYISADKCGVTDHAMTKLIVEAKGNKGNVKLINTQTGGNKGILLWQSGGNGAAVSGKHNQAVTGNAEDFVDSHGYIMCDAALQADHAYMRQEIVEVYKNLYNNILGSFTK
jgi:hypothetical protein